MWCICFSFLMFFLLFFSWQVVNVRLSAGSHHMLCVILQWPFAEFTENNVHCTSLPKIQRKKENVAAEFPTDNSHPDSCNLDSFQLRQPLSLKELVGGGGEKLLERKLSWDLTCLWELSQMVVWERIGGQLSCWSCQVNDAVFAFWLLDRVFTS